MAGAGKTKKEFLEEMILELSIEVCVIWTRELMKGFSGGAVVKNPPANAGDTGSSPGPGRSHVPQSN